MVIPVLNVPTKPSPEEDVSVGASGPGYVLFLLDQGGPGLGVQEDLRLGGKLQRRGGTAAIFQERMGPLGFPIQLEKGSAIWQVTRRRLFLPDAPSRHGRHRQSSAHKQVRCQRRLWRSDGWSGELVVRRNTAIKGG